jgi:hypothetical protein
MLLLACAFFIIVISLAPRVTAQRIDFDQWQAMPLPDTAVPWMPCYGANGNEFWIGGYIDVKPDPAHNLTASLWDFATSLGIRVFESRKGTMWERVDDTLAETAQGWDSATGRWGTCLIVNQFPLDIIGHAHSVQFFPFDSTESYYWPCQLLQALRQGIDSLHYSICIHTLAAVTVPYPD